MCFEIRYKYNLLTTPDPEDGNTYVRHRTCRFGCRNCSRLGLLDCRCKSSVGHWEVDKLRHKKNTPKLLPTDGLPKRRRPQPPLETFEVLSVCLFIFILNFEEDVGGDDLSEPLVPIGFIILYGYVLRRKRKDGPGHSV